MAKLFFAAVVVCLLGAAATAHAYQVHPSASHPCVFQANGTCFDLRNVYPWPAKLRSGKYTYSFNPCEPLPPGPCSISPGTSCCHVGLVRAHTSEAAAQLCVVEQHPRIQPPHVATLPALPCAKRGTATCMPRAVSWSHLLPGTLSTLTQMQATPFSRSTSRTYIVIGTFLCCVQRGSCFH